MYLPAQASLPVFDLEVDPQLAGILDRVPPQSDLYLYVDKLVDIDRSCLDFLFTWQKQQEQKDIIVTVPWEKLERSFYKPFVELYPSKKSVSTNTDY